ncbi:MAG: hypothetical protein KJ578_15770 [Bacteroidetes bacterium]|nr:hypothetical protein [Bacteroidota bacterium]
MPLSGTAIPTLQPVGRQPEPSLSTTTLIPEVSPLQSPHTIPLPALLKQPPKSLKKQPSLTSKPTDIVFPTPKPFEQPPPVYTTKFPVQEPGTPAMEKDIPTIPEFAGRVIVGVGTAPYRLGKSILGIFSPKYAEKIIPENIPNPLNNIASRLGFDKYPDIKITDYRTEHQHNVAQGMNPSVSLALVTGGMFADVLISRGLLEAIIPKGKALINKGAGRYMPEEIQNARMRMGVSDTATPEEIKSAYIKQAKQNHPDAGGSVKAMQQTNADYEILTGIQPKIIRAEDIVKPAPKPTPTAKKPVVAPTPVVVPTPKPIPTVETPLTEAIPTLKPEPITPIPKKLPKVEPIVAKALEVKPTNEEAVNFYTKKAITYKKAGKTASDFANDMQTIKYTAKKGDVERTYTPESMMTTIKDPKAFYKEVTQKAISIPPKQTKSPVTLFAYIKSRGGIDPNKARLAGYPYRSFKEFGLESILKKGGVGIDDLAKSLEEEGILKSSDEITSSDYLMNELQYNRKRLLNETDDLERQFEEEHSQWLKQNKEELDGETGIEGEIERELTPYIEKEIESGISAETAWLSEKPRRKQKQSAQTINADVGGYAKRPDIPQGLKAMQMPEIVEMAKGLMEGKYPIIKARLRQRMGMMPKGTFKAIGEGEISLLAEAFKNPEEIQKVLTHEIGHLVDWLPDKDMAKGNILGRIASLKKYTKHLLEEYPNAPSGILTSKDRVRIRAEAEKIIRAQFAHNIETTEAIYKEIPLTADEILSVWRDVEASIKTPKLVDYIARLSHEEKLSIVKEALKGVVADWVKFKNTVIEGYKTTTKTILPDKGRDAIRQKYFDLIKKEILKRGLYEKWKVMQELKDLTQIWKPFDDLRNPAFTKYRYSPVELYADAFSVLLNEPSLLQKTAPTFYKAFFSYIERKPNVKAIYESLQERLKLPTDEIDKIRQQKEVAIFEKGEKLWHQKKVEAIQEKKSLVDVIAEGIGDKNWEIIKKYNEAKKKGYSVSPDDDPILLLEENNYIAGKQLNLLQKIEFDVRKPLSKIGVTDEQLGLYAKFKNIVEAKNIEITPEGEIITPKRIARPGGYDQKTAQSQLDLLERQLGKENYKTFVDKMKIFYKQGTDLMEKAYKSGLLTEAQIKHIRTNPYYATTQVLDYMKAYISPSFIHQIGTLKESANPFRATLEKRLAVVLAIEKNDTRKSIYKMLESFGEKEVQPAIRKGRGKFATYHPQEGMGLIKFKDKGKWIYKSIDPYIADCLEYRPDNAIKGIARLSGAWINSKWFKPVYTTWNLGFQSYNFFFRDFRRAIKANPHKSLILSTIDTLANYYKASPHALNKVRRVRDETIEEMYENKMLGLTYQQTIDLMDMNELKELTFLMEHFGIGATTPKAKCNMILRPLLKVLDWMQDLGNFLETIPKVSGYITLKGAKKPIHIREIGHQVREYYGSPDFRKFGKWGPAYNNLSIFSNAKKEGIRSDIEMGFRNPRTRQGYWWKTFQMDILPAIMGVMASAGLFGKYVKAIYDRIPEYKKTNYTIIPLWIDKDDNAVVLRIAHDDMGRMWHALTHKILTAHKEEIGKEISNVASTVGGELPSLGPVPEMTSAMIMYMCGKSPYDFFRGREVLSIQEENVLRTKGALHPIPAKKMGLYVLSKSGLPIPREMLLPKEKQTPMNTLQKIVSSTPILSRFMIVTKYGLEEKQKKEKYKKQAEKHIQKKKPQRRFVIPAR